MGIYRKEKSWYLNFYYQGQRYQECVGPVSKTVAKEVLAKRKAEVIESRYNLNQKKLTPFFEEFAQQYLEVYSRENKRHKSYIRDITAKCLLTLLTKKFLETLFYKTFGDTNGEYFNSPNSL